MLAQTTTIEVLSDMGSPWQDLLAASPTFVGAGSLTIQGVPRVVATATIGTFAPRNRTAALRNSITAQGQTGAFWTTYVNSFVHDVTAGAWFWIDADLGSATAAISEPVSSEASGFVLPPPYVTIANGDLLQILELPKVQLGRLDTLTHNASPTITVLNVSVSSGSATSALFNPVGVTVLESRIDTYVIEANSGFAFAINDNFTQTLQTGGNFLSGMIKGAFSSIGSPNAPYATSIDGDILIEPAVPHLGASPTSIGRAYVSGNIDVDFTNGAPLTLGTRDTAGGYYADAELWGPGAMLLYAGNQLLMFNGATQGANAMLLTGGFFIDGASSAFPWVGGSTHAFGAATAISGTGVDSTGGLSNPQTGTRIAKMP